METQLITKKIKDLADEYDNNIGQLRIETRRYDQIVLDLKKENVSLNMLTWSRRS